MPAQSNLNFIPENVLNERKITKTKVAGVKVSFVLIFITTIISAVIFWFDYDQNKKISNLQSQTEQDKNKILELKEFGEKGYKLGIRVQSIKDSIDKSSKISVLMQEIKDRIPTSVNVISWKYDSTSGGLNILADGSVDYLPIEQFNLNLLKPYDVDKTLFNSVKLTTASYNKSSGNVSFSLDVKVNSALLTNGSN